MRESDTYTPDMYRAYIRSLMILIAGGKPEHGEKDRWLEEISKRTAPYCKDGRSLGIRSLRAAYDGQWISRRQYVSKKTQETLEAVAENARKTQTLVEFIEVQLAIYEEAPEFFGARRINLVRNFVSALREFDAESARQDAARRRSAVPADNDEAPIAAVSPVPSR